MLLKRLFFYDFLKKLVIGLQRSKRWIIFFHAVIKGSVSSCLMAYWVHPTVKGQTWYSGPVMYRKV